MDEYSFLTWAKFQADRRGLERQAATNAAQRGVAQAGGLLAIARFSGKNVVAVLASLLINVALAVAFDQGAQRAASLPVGEVSITQVTPESVALLAKVASSESLPL